MTILQSEYLLGVYEKSMPNHFSLSEKLVTARDAGFDYLELSIDETDEKLARLSMNRSQRRELIEQMSDTMMPIRTLCLSGHRRFPLGDPDAKTRETGLEIMSRAIDLAASLGVRIIQLAGYDVYYKESDESTRALFHQNLHKSVEMAARSGVVLAFETMETPFMDTVAKALSWVRALNSPYLQIYPDVGNLTNAALLYGHDVVEDIRSGSGNMVALHLKETAPGVYREMDYGTGHVDFVSCIRAGWESGVRMFTGEFWYREGSDARCVLQNSRLFLREMISRHDS